MTNWYDIYWANLKSVIQSAWPDMPAGQFYSDTSLERYDWINLLNSGQMSGVWCAVKIDISPDDTLPDWPAYSVAATINYITPSKFTPGADAAEKTVAEFIAGKLTLLSQALRACLTLGTVETEIPLSVNADNAINVGLLGGKVPYQSGSLTVTSVVIDGGNT